MTCPICKNKSYTIIGKPKINSRLSNLIRHDYKTVKCNECSFYYVTPKIDFTNEEWAFLYNEEYFEEPTKWHLKKREGERITRFNNLVKYSKNKITKFLDIGCGEGLTLLEAEKRGWEPYGLDIFDNRVEAAKKPTFNFFLNDLISAKLPDNYFDAIFLDSVLEHVLNPLEYLSEIKRILRAGGVLYIGVPNEDSLFNFIRQIIMKITGEGKRAAELQPFSTPYHVGGFNLNSLPFTIKKVGLKLRYMRNFGTKLEFRKAKFLSKNNLIGLSMLPIFLLSVPLKKEVYIEAYIEK